MKNKKDVIATVRLDKVLAGIVDDLAEKSDRTRSNIIRVLIREALISRTQMSLKQILAGK